MSLCAVFFTAFVSCDHYRHNRYCDLNGSVPEGDDVNISSDPENRLTSRKVPNSVDNDGPSSKLKEEDGEEDGENMDVWLEKFAPNSDLDKVVKMQSILSQFTEEQMSRYESFHRSGFQKSNMKKVGGHSHLIFDQSITFSQSKQLLLTSITGSSKISMPMTIVVSGAKLFVGELVETARMVIAERKDTGPIRPCHMREAYRRLKLEGKIPKGSVPRIFR